MAERAGTVRSSLLGRLSDVGEGFRASLWPLPVACVVLALAAGVLLPELDLHVDSSLPPGVESLIFGGGAGAARTVLSSVASSLINVTSLTFSLTVVTLQLASSQFSPRLLRTFSRDRFVHATLALFLGTFTYALTVLRTVRSADEGGSPFVPQLSVTVAFVLAVASVVMLVLFLAHLAREIRVETTVETVHEDASAAVRSLLGGTGTQGGQGEDEEGPEDARQPGSGPDGRYLAGVGSAPRTDHRPTGDPDALAALQHPPHGARLLAARRSGFLLRVDAAGVREAAEAAGAVVAVEVQPGDAVVAGTPVARAWALDGGDLDDDALAALHDEVCEALTTGQERTLGQDVAYGIRQLTDVVSKALSPGVNDPTTAVHTLARTSALLCQMASRPLGPVAVRDDDGRVRVALARPDLADLLELAVAQPRRYGAADPDVMARLAVLLREVAWCTPPAGAQAVAAQLERLEATVGKQDFDAAESDRLRGLVEQVRDACDGRWPAPAARTTSSVA